MPEANEETHPRVHAMFVLFIQQFSARPYGNFVQKIKYMGQPYRLIIHVLRYQAETFKYAAVTRQKICSSSKRGL